MAPELIEAIGNNIVAPIIMVIILATAVRVLVDLWLRKP